MSRQNSIPKEHRLTEDHYRDLCAFWLLPTDGDFKTLRARFDACMKQYGVVHPFRTIRGAERFSDLMFTDYFDDVFTNEDEKLKHIYGVFDYHLGRRKFFEKYPEFHANYCHVIENVGLPEIMSVPALPGRVAKSSDERYVERANAYTDRILEEALSEYPGLDEDELRELIESVVDVEIASGASEIEAARRLVDSLSDSLYDLFPNYCEPSEDDCESYWMI